MRFRPTLELALRVLPGSRRPRSCTVRMDRRGVNDSPDASQEPLQQDSGQVSTEAYGSLSLDRRLSLRSGRLVGRRGAVEVGSVAVRDGRIGARRRPLRRRVLDCRSGLVGSVVRPRRAGRRSAGTASRRRRRKPPGRRALGIAHVDVGGAGARRGRPARAPRRSTWRAGARPSPKRSSGPVAQLDAQPCAPGADCDDSRPQARRGAAASSPTGTASGRGRLVSRPPARRARDVARIRRRPGAPRSSVPSSATATRGARRTTIAPTGTCSITVMLQPVREVRSSTGCPRRSGRRATAARSAPRSTCERRHVLRGGLERRARCAARSGPVTPVTVDVVGPRRATSRAATASRATSRRAGPRCAAQQRTRGRAAPAARTRGAGDAARWSARRRDARAIPCDSPPSARSCGFALGRGVRRPASRRRARRTSPAPDDEQQVALAQHARAGSARRRRSPAARPRSARRRRRRPPRRRVSPLTPGKSSARSRAAVDVEHDRESASASARPNSRRERAPCASRGAAGRRRSTRRGCERAGGLDRRARPRSGGARSRRRPRRPPRSRPSALEAPRRAAEARRAPRPRAPVRAREPARLERRDGVERVVVPRHGERDLRARASRSRDPPARARRPARRTRRPAPPRSASSSGRSQTTACSAAARKARGTPRSSSASEP